MKMKQSLVVLLVTMILTMSSRALGRGRRVKGTGTRGGNPRQLTRPASRQRLAYGLYNINYYEVC